MMYPTLHLNGTSYQDLMEQIANALSKLRTAYFALEKAGPNGRDYYVQGNDAIIKAQNEHAARLNAITDVMHDLSLIQDNLLDQNDKREEQKRR